MDNKMSDKNKSISLDPFRVKETQTGKLSPSESPRPIPPSSSSSLRPPSLISLANSAAAGLVARIASHPMDTIRARMMVNAPSLSVQINATRAALRPQTPSSPYTGILDEIRLMSKSQGGLIRNLYRGFPTTALLQCPGVATYLTTYDAAKYYITNTLSPDHSQDGIDLNPENYISALSRIFYPQSPLVHLSAGIIAEAVSCIFWVPMEVIAQRIQVREKKTSGTFIAKDIWAREGIRGFYKGYTMTMIVFGPSVMLYWILYEHCKKMWFRYAPLVSEATADLPSSVVMLSAAGSAAISAALTVPLDICKTRIQTQDDLVVQSVKQGKRYKGLVDALKSIWKHEGLRGLTHGWSAIILRNAPKTAVTMTVFEKLKSISNSG